MPSTAFGRSLWMSTSPAEPFLPLCLASGVWKSISCSSAGVHCRQLITRLFGLHRLSRSGSNEQKHCRKRWSNASPSILLSNIGKLLCVQS